MGLTLTSGPGSQVRRHVGGGPSCPSPPFHQARTARHTIREEWLSPDPAPAHRDRVGQSSSAGRKCKCWPHSPRQASSEDTGKTMQTRRRPGDNRGKAWRDEATRSWQNTKMFPQALRTPTPGPTSREGQNTLLPPEPPHKLAYLGPPGHACPPSLSSHIPGHWAASVQGEASSSVHPS